MISKNELWRQIIMAINIGINGFGRIGRLIFREGILREDLNFVAIV